MKRYAYIIESLLLQTVNTKNASESALWAKAAVDAATALKFLGEIKSETPASGQSERLPPGSDLDTE